MNSGIKDYDIQALVDGELSAEEARRVKSEIEQSSVLQERYEELLEQKAMLQKWWQRLH